jgi:hypothetical protein
MLQGGVAADGGWLYQAVIKEDSADAPERISGPHPSAANLLILLGRVFLVHRRAVLGTGPTGTRTAKDSRLRRDRRFDIQRPRRNHDDVGTLHLPWHTAAAEAAKGVGEPLSLRDLERADLIFATDPLQRAGLKEQVRSVSGPGRLAAARAVAVIEPADGRVARPFGFALTDPSMRLSRTRLFPERTCAIGVAGPRNE